MTRRKIVSRLLIWGLAAAAPPCWVGVSLAQPAAEEAVEAEEESVGEPTDPRAVELETSDGVLLVGTFYGVDNAGPHTPIVVMLADEDESPAVFDRLAFRLHMPDVDEKRTPAAVLAIGLRGQGDSTRVRAPDGSIVDRRGAELRRADGVAMVKKDMEAVRKFLVEKNDARELNLNRLGYLGVGRGTLVAAGAAAVDWSMPPISRGKQGQDVKAMIMVSPVWERLGLKMMSAVQQKGVQSRVGVMLTYGGDDPDVSRDAQRIVRQLEKGRMKPPAEDIPIARLIDLPANTGLQGSSLLKLLGERGEVVIANFFEDQLAKPDLPWVKRRLN